MLKLQEQGHKEELPTSAFLFEMLRSCKDIGWVKLSSLGKGSSKAIDSVTWGGCGCDLRGWPPCFVNHLSHPDPLSLTTCISPALQHKTRSWGPPFWVFASISGVGNRKCFSLSFPPTVPNKLYYYFYLKKKKEISYMIIMVGVGAEKNSWHSLTFIYD
jgi:hypothetical protein